VSLARKAEHQIEWVKKRVVTKQMMYHTVEWHYQLLELESRKMDLFDADGWSLD